MNKADCHNNESISAEIAVLYFNRRFLDDDWKKTNQCIQNACKSGGIEYRTLDTENFFIGLNIVFWHEVDSADFKKEVIPIIDDPRRELTRPVVIVRFSSKILTDDHRSVIVRGKQRRDNRYILYARNFQEWIKDKTEEDFLLLIHALCNIDLVEIICDKKKRRPTNLNGEQKHLLGILQEVFDPLPAGDVLAAMYIICQVANEKSDLISPEEWQCGIQKLRLNDREEEIKQANSVIGKLLKTIFERNKSPGSLEITEAINALSPIYGDAK